MGKRGPKLGARWTQKATLGANEQKAIARQTIRDHVISHIPKIIAAQVDNALGVPYMVLRAPDGSFVRATDEKQVDAALAAGAASFKLYTKEPHQGSASMLLSYAADKAVEPVEVSGPDGGPVEFQAILQKARKRAAQRD
jgi:hypothetical protein